MGKNLKGKECGKGICQRKDGMYFAGFVDKRGNRKEKYFLKLPDARNWLDDARYADRHQQVIASTDITVDTWFEYWMENIICDLSYNTKRNYNDRYTRNVQPIIGEMLISEVKSLHCMHTLRHTYATRAIERGVQPKVLQKLLGHASIKTTMDRYVHVTEDSLINAVKLFEQGA